jgi:ribosomal protein L15
MRGFEGGQMPLHRRLPKRGFTNIFRTEYTVVNLDRIAEQIEGLKVTEIGLDDYKKLGLASSKKALIKILGSGELTAAITIHAHKFSKSAVEKIEKAGGKAVVLGGGPAPGQANWFPTLRQRANWGTRRVHLPGGQGPGDSTGAQGSVVVTARIDCSIRGVP